MMMVITSTTGANNNNNNNKIIGRRAVALRAGCKVCDAMLLATNIYIQRKTYFFANEEEIINMILYICSFDKEHD